MNATTHYNIEEILQHLENCNYIGAKEAIKLIHKLNQRRMALQQRVADLEDQVSNLRQWEKRYLDVIESLSQDSKQALNPELRTHDGKAQEK